MNGLVLPTHIHDLPVLSPPTTAAPPIRALPITTFSALHLSHVLSHPPDHVLFPFLHGLEGDNVAQNTFFSGANVRVPAYRGLVWVVCEDDLVKDERRFERSLGMLRRRGGWVGLNGNGNGNVNVNGEESASESSSASEGSSEFEGDEEDDEDMVYTTEPRVIPMDIDADVDVEFDAGEAIRVVVEPGLKEEKHHHPMHMHPVVQRPAPLQIQIQTVNLTDRDDISTAIRFAFFRSMLF
jgi:dual specificity MAP kinase phosphatase